MDWACAFALTGLQGLPLGTVGLGVAVASEAVVDGPGALGPGELGADALEWKLGADGARLSLRCGDNGEDGQGAAQQQGLDPSGRAVHDVSFSRSIAPSILRRPNSRAAR